MSGVRVLVASNRPSVHTFFADRERENGCFVSLHAPLDDRALAESNGYLHSATLAVVDVAGEHEEAQLVCEAISIQRPELPILAVVCCPRPITVRALDNLLGARVSGVVDALTSPEDIVRAIEGLAQGVREMRIHLHGELGTYVRTLLGDRGGSDGRLLAEHDAQLLELVARGLDAEAIAHHLGLGTSTVNHRIGSLCARLGLSNKQELAAWAAWYGLYEPPQLAGSCLKNDKILQQIGKS